MNLSSLRARNGAGGDGRILNELGFCIALRLFGLDVSHSVRRNLLRSGRNAFNICRACKFLSRLSEPRISRKLGLCSVMHAICLVLTLCGIVCMSPAPLRYLVFDPAKTDQTQLLPN